MSKQSQAATAAQIQPQKRRRYTRHSLDARIQVSVFREGNNVLLWGRTSEIGIDGLGATLTGELTSGEVASLEFTVPVSPHFLKLRGIVRYTQGLHCGFEFLTVSEAQRNTLHEVCAMLERVI